MEEEIEKIITPVLQELGIDLVELKLLGQGNRTILRIYVDEIGGISLDRCVVASRAISDILDRKDPIPTRYILQVSSPGVSRPLKTEKDFLHHLHKKVQVRYRHDDEDLTFTGTIAGVDDHVVTLVDSEREQRRIEISQVLSAKEIITFKK